MVGPLKALSSYRGLQLSWNISEKPGAIGEVTYAHQPAALLRFIRHWDGKITGYDARLSLWVLIFVLSESLRFRSIENTCARWIRPIGGTSPDHAGWPVLTITKAMLDTVQNWHARARAGDSDIWTWPPEMPDTIIT